MTIIAYSIGDFKDRGSAKGPGDEETEGYIRVPKDLGCRHSPSCLDCVLPRCIYDDPLQVVRVDSDESKQLALKVGEMESLGLSRVDACRRLASDLGYSVNKVYRLAMRGGLKRLGSGKSRRRQQR